MNSRTSLITALLMAGGIAVAATGCASSAPSADAAGSSTSLNPLSGIDTAPQYNAEIAASVSEEFRDGLTVGTDATNAPKEFLADDGETFTGVDIDFTYAIGTVLGVQMNFVNAGFDTLLPGVQNGRYDFVASSAAPTLEREQVVDFVSIDRSGESLLTKKEDAGTLSDIEALCGHVVGAIKGSLQVEDLAEQSTKCEAGGEAAIETSLFPDSASVNLALGSGRVEVAFFDTPTSAYQAKNSDGSLVVVGPIYRAGLEGVFMKKDGGLAGPVAAAVNELIASGVYQEILDKWGLSDSAVETAYVNPATSGKADE
jgi:polar amino acid transport system substrate-binding protein